MDKKRILRIVLIVIAIIVLLGIIYMVRNYTIMKDLNAKIDEIQKVTNYSYVFEDIYNGTTYRTEVYRKDNIKTTKTIEKDKEGNEIKKLSRYDNSNDEHIMINYTKGLVRIDKPSYGTDLSNGIDPHFKFSLSILEILRTRITEEECYGQKCYVINDQLIINKEDGTLVKTRYPGVSENFCQKDWKVNVVTDEDVVRPDLTGLELTTKNVFMD